MKALVTGAAGFAGRHLVAALRAKGWDVHALVLRPADLAVPQTAVDIRTPPSAWPRLPGRFDAVFHLAGQAAVPQSTEDPRETFAINLEGTLHLYEAVGRGPRFVFVGSGYPYGSSDHPIRETEPFHPANPYAESKAQADRRSLELAARGWDIVVVRPFNHIGPGQSRGFVVPDFARQIVDAERGRSDEIRVGNLDVTRDFTDVRDMAAAYILAAEKCPAGEPFNIARGVGHTIRSILGNLLACSAARPRIVEEAGRQRVESQARIGDASKFRAATGWKPGIPIEQTLRESLEEMRRREG